MGWREWSSFCPRLHESKINSDKGKLASNIEAYKQTLLESWEELPPIFITSSEAKEGRDELLNYIEDINKTIIS